MPYLKLSALNIKHLRIFKGIFFLLFCLVFISFSSEDYSFSDRDYAKYNWHTFSELPAVNQIIDLNKIDYDLLNAAIFFATNEQREKKNKPVFEFSVALRDAAKLHTEQMVERNFFSHIGKTRKYKTPSERTAIFGIAKNALIGENILLEFSLKYNPKKAYNVKVQDGKTMYYYMPSGQAIEMHTYWSFAQAALDSWMHSPPHKKNILNSSFSKLGCSAILDASTLNSKKSLPSFKATQNFSD